MMELRPSALVAYISNLHAKLALVILYIRLLKVNYVLFLKNSYMSPLKKVFFTQISLKTTIDFQ
ncbi:hypothetical protein D7D25_06785 [Proteiniphilum sp. X52]|nr:hypothetical protein D7D25_06785 [Proteiniphilum sp. X52]